jgi:hypothetical protein
MKAQYTAVCDIGGDVEFLYQGEDLSKAIKALRDRAINIFMELTHEHSIEQSKSLTLVRDPMNHILTVDFQATKQIR